ncbi:MAG: TonB-dependent receptor [bacterium]|nr:TonB-dependent receptor [bacterium]
MPPLEARVELLRPFTRSWVGLHTRLVTRQTRVARTSSLEDPTPGFALLGARAGIDLTGQRRLRIAVDNLLDRYYYEHLSVGNFPGQGRNLHVSLAVAF